MSRMRYLGRPAANPDDILTQRQLSAFSAALPGQYLELSRLNLANGVPQLDANARMGNSYLPTDIARTTLTSSGKTKAGTLEVTGASTLDSLSVTNAATVGSLTVSGAAQFNGAATFSAALNAGSATLTGQINAATASIPENVATTFKAKDTTLTKLTVSGATSIASLTTSGDISTQAIGATALTASGEAKAATLRATSSLIAEGATSLQAVTVAGVLSSQGIAAAGRINANAGLRIGNNQTLSQVDANDNAVPVKITGGLDLNSSALVGVTTLGIASLSVSGVASVGGKATVGDFESQAGGKFNGALTGITDLTMSGNLSVTGSGKKITATALQVNGATTTAGLTSTGASSFTSASFSGAVTIPKGTTDNHALRFDQSFGRIAISYPSAKPSIAHGSSGNPAYANNWTEISMDSWAGSTNYDADMLLDRSGSSHTCKAAGAGLYVISAHVDFDERNNAGTKSVAITINGTFFAMNDTASWEGRLSACWVGLLFEGDVVKLLATQGTGSALLSGAGSAGTSLRFMRIRAMN